MLTLTPQETRRLASRLLQRRKNANSDPGLGVESWVVWGVWLMRWFLGVVCVWMVLTVGAGPGLAAGDQPAGTRAGKKGGEDAGSLKPQSQGSAVNVTDSFPRGVEEYQIGAHDLIEISVFQVVELSRTVRVNSRGLITLPLIGAVKAGGLTSEELEAEIAKKLAAGLIQDPQVSVFIKEFVSQRVIVEGSVTRTGVFPLTGRTTLLQVIALASGLDPVANENEIRIFRQDNEGKREMLAYDIEAIRAGTAEDPVIKGNDMVVVGKSAIRSAIKTVTDTVRGFIGFGTVR